MNKIFKQKINESKTLKIFTKIISVFFILMFVQLILNQILDEVAADIIIQMVVSALILVWLVLSLSKRYNWRYATKIISVILTFFISCLNTLNHDKGVKDNLSKLWFPIQFKLEKYELNKVFKLKISNPRKAFELLQEYADGSNKLAKSHIFGCYIREDVAESYWVKTNFKKAIEYYDELVKFESKIMDHPKFLYLLGLAYCQGDDSLRQDTAKGIRYLEQAVAKNDDEACILLGIYYFYGSHGIPIDEQKGLSLIHQAANRGFASAQYLLATYYYDTDEAKSISYLNKAADQGHEDAVNALNEINSQNKDKKP